jgi:GTP-binding protein
MTIKSAQYFIQSPSLALCPEETLPEFAFIGRSNVGKSSLINFITNNSNLARTSKTPGKTRLISHYIINNNWFMVDLPGYGYAKTSKENREMWGKFIEDYILHRDTLRTLFVLVDGRIKPQKIDIEFIHWLELKRINYTLVVTKIDKVNQKDLHAFISVYKTKINPTVTIIAASALAKLGKDLILDKIQTEIDN